MLFGLETHIYTNIKKVFEQFPKIDEVIIFGSRALNTCRPQSDIDLALKGSEISFSDILKITSKLEELPHIYKFDVISYHKIKNQALIEHIDQYGKCFYKRSLKK